MHTLTTIEEIKKAVDEGKLVHCGSNRYRVIRDSINQYMITDIFSDYHIYLHGMAGTAYENRLNGNHFYIKE